MLALFVISLSLFTNCASGGVSLLEKHKITTTVQQTADAGISDLEAEIVAEVISLFIADPFALGLAAFIIASAVVERAVEAGVEVRSA